ncbi:MAG: SPFH domain-containing protein [Muribaculaceae bacterium]|nr:SPFH domain-containing protein [Muribaculaceae bacterium]
MANNKNSEFSYNGIVINGFIMVVIIFIILPAIALLSLWIFYNLIIGIVIAAIIGLFALISLGGFFIQEPNEARVMIFFGSYVGTCRQVGFYWANPFVTRKKLSLRIRNMDIEPIKVNDKIGNPVLIGMVLVWKIKDTYKVVFDLDSQSLGVGSSINARALDTFVRIQSDAALREVTGQFAYDPTDYSEHSGHEQHNITLRDGGDIINDLLEKKINERLEMAGMEVVEARLNYLAYAPEIAAVMLRRQQAAAIISAREKIVEGAVSMVEMALHELEHRNVVVLTQENRAALVSNLMVVLCGDEPVTPMLNTSQS